jgi:hypothetical protein
MEQPETLAHRRGTLEHPARLRARAAARRAGLGRAHRLASDRTVSGKGADEPAVALRCGSGAEPEQRSIGMALEGRQNGKRLEIRLPARALAVIVGQFAGEHAPQPTGLARREPKEAQVQLVVPIT